MFSLGLGLHARLRCCLRVLRRRLFECRCCHGFAFGFYITINCQVLLI